MKKKAVDFTPLYKKYPGKWVVLSEDEKTVVAVGKTAKEAFSAGKKTKEKKSILYKVPSKISFSISISISRG